MCPSTHEVQLQSLLKLNGFHNDIEAPTRVTSNSSTLTDVCITNIGEGQLSAAAVLTDFGDHFKLFLFTKKVKHASPKQEMETYHQPITQQTIDTFKDAISEVD